MRSRISQLSDQGYTFGSYLKEEGQRQYINFATTASPETERKMRSTLENRYDAPIDDLKVENGIAYAYFVEKGYSKTPRKEGEFTFNKGGESKMQKYANNVIRAASLNKIRVRKVVVSVDYD